MELRSKIIDGFPDYRIYEDGRVQNMRTGNYIKQRITKGYPNFQLFEDTHRWARTRTVHRLLAIAFIPNPENKPEVNHINGIKADFGLENLEWVTCRENIIHAIGLGLMKPTNNLRMLSLEECRKYSARAREKNRKKVVDIKTKTIFPSIAVAADLYGYANRTLCSWLDGRSPNKSNLRLLNTVNQ